MTSDREVFTSKELPVGAQRSSVAVTEPTSPLVCLSVQTETSAVWLAERAITEEKKGSCES